MILIRRSVIDRRNSTSRTSTGRRRRIGPVTLGTGFGCPSCRGRLPALRDPRLRAPLRTCWSSSPSASRRPSRRPRRRAPCRTRRAASRRPVPARGTARTRATTRVPARAAAGGSRGARDRSASRAAGSSRRPSSTELRHPRSSAPRPIQAKGTRGGVPWRLHHIHVQPPSTTRLMPFMASFSSKKRAADDDFRHRHEPPDGRPVDECLKPLGRHVAPLRAVAHDGRVERVHPHGRELDHKCAHEARHPSVHGRHRRRARIRPVAREPAEDEDAGARVKPRQQCVDHRRVADRA